MNYQRESKEQTGGTANRRTVVLDIETVSLDPSSEEGALNAMTGRIVCIGMLMQDGDAISEVMFASEDERALMTGFWAVLKPGDVIVGHNVLDFDIRFLQQRSWILDIKPSRTFDARRYYTKEVIDTMQLWTNWTGSKKGVTLDGIALALGCGRKTGDGGKVSQWWADRDIETITRYCRADVRLTYRVFCRLLYREPKQIAPANEAFANPVIDATADVIAEVRIT